MDKIVYLLGAGFSRPLGLPIMSDFMDKAKDLYFSNKPEYKYFYDVFTRIKNLSYIMRFYDADLNNIEEILSTLEMQRLLGDNEDQKIDFINFLIDVIASHTPEFINRYRPDRRGDGTYGSQTPRTFRALLPTSISADYALFCSWII
jgi:hypothetical protein